MHRPLASSLLAPRPRVGFILDRDWRFLDYLGKRGSFLYFSGRHRITKQAVWFAVPMEQDDEISANELSRRFIAQWPSVEPIALVVSDDGMFVVLPPPAAALL